MPNLILVQDCTLSALGLGGYKVVVILVFIVFCLIGGALAFAEDGLFGVIMALVCGLFAALLIYSLFHPTGSPPTTGGPVEITPVVLIPMIVISVIAVTITVVVAVRKLKEGEFPEIGIFEIGWVTSILVTLGVGILGLFGRGPFALGKDLPQSEETGGEIAVGPVSVGVGPYIGLAAFNLIAVAMTIGGLTMIIRNGGERRDGLILSLIGVGCLLFADVPTAAMIANGCPLAIVVLGAITTTQQ